MGFPVPLDKWLGGSFADQARKILNDEDNIANQVIDTRFVLSLLDDKDLSKDHGLAMKVWMVLYQSAQKCNLMLFIFEADTTFWNNSPQ
ncbi:hypothetical protein [Colwellia polaris]|jgi:asparagine synthase (glutamine-hydrolysing)|uniref:hypothetical protein n=1 Tax=Colwellia polaris TaxID=326537 RepID=UPI000A1775C5|nr:hypothetical protein [Colwellia polaris]